MVFSIVKIHIFELDILIATRTNIERASKCQVRVRLSSL